ncbi:MAG: sensor histidine kinase [Actinomycetota bacterium]
MRTRPSSVSALVGLTTASAAVLTVPWLFTNVRRWSADDWLVSLALALATATLERFEVRLRQGSEGHSFTVEEAVYAAAIPFTAAGALTLAVVAATAVTQVARRRGLKKALFNVGQFALSTLAMEWVFGAMRPSDDVGVALWGAIAASLLAFTVVNSGLTVAVVSLASGDRMHRVLLETWQITAWDLAATLGLGISAATLWWAQPVSIVFLIVPLALWFVAHRGWVLERDRNRNLYEAGTSLFGSIDRSPELAEFVRAVERTFAAAGALLLLEEDGRVIAHDGGIPRELGPTDGTLDDRLAPPPGMHAATAPVGATDGASGLLVVYGDRPLVRRDHEALEALAGQLGLVLDNRRLYLDLHRVTTQRLLLLEQLVRTQEQERHRIAEEIHDDPVQTLTAIGIRLGMARSKLRDPKDAAAMERLESLVSSAIGRLRALIFELVPQSLEHDGLAAALTGYLEQVAVDTGIAWELDDSTARELPLELRTMLYRIAQEALSNVSRHSDASNVRIVLEGSDDGFSVRIEDDGRGFDPGATTTAPGHMGLPSMYERAEMAGGWCRITSDLGKGTAVEIWIPSPVDGELVVDAARTA